MTEKLTDAVNRCINNYSAILNNFPPDGQKQTSRYYEIDCHHTNILNKLDIFSKKTKQLTSADGQHMKQMLIDSLDLAERKVEISECLMEMVGENMFKLKRNLKDIEMAHVSENKPSKKHGKQPERMLKWVPNYKEIDSDSIDDVLNVDDSNEHLIINKLQISKTTNKKSQLKENLDSKFQSSVAIYTGTNQNIKNTTKSKNPRRQCSKKKRTLIAESSDSDSDVQPTYCICEEISYGDMVCCDNDLCPIEWFHFDCVSLRRKPKGKWYCPRCRGTNSKVMKPRKIFFKELEEYNKRKEENW